MRAITSKRLLIASFALAIGLAGCASGGSGGGGGGGGNPNQLTNEALQAAIGSDAYQAIQRLRPRWLQSRGGNSANVFVDGQERPGGLEVLRGFPVADIDEMLYMSASEATTRYGTGHPNGLIVIMTKR